MNPEAKSMLPQSRQDYVTRDAILKLLSDDELGAVSTAETRPVIPKGTEYIDLEALDCEVQLAGSGPIAIGRILCRTSVGVATWSAILATLAGFPPLGSLATATEVVDDKGLLPLSAPMYGPIQGTGATRTL